VAAIPTTPRVPNIESVNPLKGEPMKTTPSFDQHLDQAMKDAANVSAYGILEDVPISNRISLLLDAVVSIKPGEERYRLSRIVHLTSHWAELEDPSRDALADIHDHAVRIVERGSAYQIDVANLTCWVIDIAAATVNEKSPRPTLIILGARALVWATETIEAEGGKSSALPSNTYRKSWQK
jgi:hypothetical protein